jgi:hypothetical protein
VPLPGYSKGMEPLLDLRHEQLNLLIAPRAFGNRLMTACIARLALAGPVRVLDGGNLFDVLTIARSIRRQTASLEAVLKRVAVARAFTCYQMAVMLAQQADGPTPVLILDLLSTYYDESVPLAARLRLLGQSVVQLQRLSRQAPLAVSTTPPPAGQPGDLLSRLEAAAGRVWHFELPVEPQQPRLF